MVYCVAAPNTYTPAAITPSSAGLCVRSPSRSANNFGSATVMALKVVEIAITTTNSASSTRHISFLAMRT